MKKIDDLMKVKPVYMAVIDGEIIKESYSITECKKALIKQFKKDLKNEKPYMCVSDYTIQMYSINYYNIEEVENYEKV